MAYRDDISALNPDHHWDFDGDSTDQIGSVDGTDTSILYTSSAIAEDATNCAETNAITDRVTLPTTTDINNSAQSRKAVSGWFMATAIQNPPKSIYGEGNASQAFRFILGWGNRLMFEVDDPSFTLQIFGDVALAVNRPYHLTMIFEGNGFGNELRAYLDGVEQLNAQPTDRQPDSATLTARTAGEFGDPAGTVGVGGVAVILLAPINGKWNHWATWDGADAVLTDTEVREELFEKGALADNTISAGTETAMQTSLDALADTVRSDAPLCIRIEEPSVLTANYFDGSDEIATDSGSDWSNVTNADDGATGTTASTSAVSGSVLSVKGTDYTGGDGIGKVEWRAFGVRGAAGEGHIEIFEDGDVTLLDQDFSAVPTTLGWGSWRTLTVPAGGWTEAKVQALGFEADTTDGSGTFQLARVEIRVTPSVTLEADNITFDPLASIHVQYMGTDTLTWINTNGSDASIASTPNGGTVVIKERTDLAITVLDATDFTPVSGARVYLEADTGGDLTAGDEIMNTITNGSGVATLSFDYTSDQPIVGRVRKGSASTYYKTAPIAGSILNTGLTQTILVVPDE